MNTTYDRFHKLDQQVKDYSESFRAATLNLKLVPLPQLIISL